MVELIDHKYFIRSIRRHEGEKIAEGFTCWQQLVSVLFCHLGTAQSLSEICVGLVSCLESNRLMSMGLPQAPKRSTLAYANEHRSYKIFEDVFYHLLEKAQYCIQGAHPFKFKNKLFSLDATAIDLCVSMFDWTKFRRAKGAVKMHLLLNHDGYLPVYTYMSNGKMREIRATKEAVIPDFVFPRAASSSLTVGIMIMHCWITGANRASGLSHE